MPFSPRRGEPSKGARPRGGQNGFRGGTKKSQTQRAAASRGRALPRKALAPSKLLEALRKSGRFLANFAPAPPFRSPAPKGPQVPKPQPPFHLTEPSPPPFPDTGSPSPRSSMDRKPLPAGGPARGLQPAATFSCPGRPPSPSHPGPPRRRLGPPPPLPARSPSRRRSGSFKLKPLSQPPPAPPSSACSRSVPPCPAPHRNECGRAARPAPPRRAASRPPSRRGLQRQQRRPRRMV